MASRTARLAAGVAVVLLIAYAVGDMSLRRMLLVGGGAAFTPVASPAFPTAWGVSRFGGNPIIDVDDNPAEVAGLGTEQYDPYPIKVGDSIWVYVKGSFSIYAWVSVDGGETFTLANGGDPVIEGDAGEWDSDFTLEPVLVYDAANDTIHLWYKGRGAASDSWQWGHATAPGSDPTDFTKDPANPIFAKTDAETDIGDDLGDFAISDVLMIGSTFHFYGYGEIGGVGGDYALMHATGTTWNDPSGLTNILDAPAGGVVSTPAVARVPGSSRYAMFYSHDVSGGTVFPERIKVGQSPDGEDWTFPGTDVITPATGWEDDSSYAGHFLRLTTAPYDLPLLDDMGRWRFYYSGFQVSTGQANSGLIYLEPS